MSPRRHPVSAIPAPPRRSLTLSPPRFDQEPLPRTINRYTGYTVLCMLAILLVVLLGATFATPLVASSWNVPAIVVTVLIVLALDQLFRILRPKAATNTVKYTLCAFALLVVLYGLGVSHSTIVNGKVYLDTSPTAHAASTSTQLGTWVQELRANDYLLTLSPARAKAEYAVFQSATALATKINTACFSEHANPPLFRGAYSALGNAAYWQAKAFTNITNNLTEAGVTTNATEASDEATYQSDLATARQLISADAATFGIRVDV